MARAAPGVPYAVAALSCGRAESVGMGTDPLLSDPSEISRSPHEVWSREVRVTPRADGSRLRLTVRLTPFQAKPDLEIAVTDARGEEVASTRIIENPDSDLNLRLHIRHADPAGTYLARLLLRRPGQDPVDQVRVSFSMPALAASGDPPHQDE